MNKIYPKIVNMFKLVSRKKGEFNLWKQELHDWLFKNFQKMAYFVRKHLTAKHWFFYYRIFLPIDCCCSSLFGRCMCSTSAKAKPTIHFISKCLLKWCRSHLFPFIYITCSVPRCCISILQCISVGLQFVRFIRISNIVLTWTID